ncbi:arginine N-succinyltransferase subunit alpha (plasmid) [Cupriavidus necator N-1]|uniref:Arginine N-succinyltransferase subunit alpha n=1 Tax=Cupriavidus necator (strain ATCC 43291 / DSM 13513 / CCUG 52238 / LMG 8453 / N-1) TaxID=1042878 RepID=F8GVJ0_CUPNN|nr:arginine N-succinyltransferase [Cupriavidus necator]AEI81549.1 arginine N-succinyltransferase subunit alpha [Cupriavidus necator N-1]MDX6007918.1 arginine N-succinyltransferase [Cupriavidus necator]
MLVLRAIRFADLPALLSLAGRVGPGMTTLKADPDALARRIVTAEASFAGTIAPTERDYVFVLENTRNGDIAGVSAIKAAVGLDEAFYSFRLGQLVHSSREIGVYSNKKTLFLSNDLTGCAELRTLFLDPSHRQGHNGKLLSKGRLMFAASFVDLLPDVLCAELRGYLRPDGTSPFWESLGQHFFKMDFSVADDHSGGGAKSFIAELMPRFPIYADFLTEEAQAVIGRVHASTEPARRMLEQEGMAYEGLVDIFDAGPVVQGHIRHLRITKESTLAIAYPVPDGTRALHAGAPQLVCNTRLADFRAIVTDAAPAFGRLSLTHEECAALAVDAGNPVRVATLKPGNIAHGQPT